MNMGIIGLFYKSVKKKDGSGEREMGRKHQRQMEDSIKMNIELAKGEQALVCLRQIQRSTSNIE